MQVSLHYLLELASRGDDLANEAVRTIFEASMHGLHASAYMSFSGSAITIKYFPALPALKIKLDS